jgi:hypothetical protein
MKGGVDPINRRKRARAMHRRCIGRPALGHPATYQRHCERSEAIHFTAVPVWKLDCFVASAFARRRASADKGSSQ